MMNFLRKHWRGEYSLPRSYWLHGSLLGLLIGTGAVFLAASTTEALGTPYALPLEITSLVCCLFILVYLVWATGGIWRSATRRGGFWAGAAKVGLVLGWLSAISQVVSQVPRPAPLAPIDEPHLDTGPNAAQSWGQVGQWVIRYDSSDGGDGIPNGCYMYRLHGSAILRIGFYGPANDYSVMFGNDTLSTRIENNKYYSINLTFGNETPWTVEATAKFFPGTNIKMLIFRTSQQQFFADLVSNTHLIISQNGSSISEFSLKNAKDALTAMQKCQESHGQNPPKGS